MQCIARRIKHLPVTHLEVVTLAYAAINFVIYIFWWNKPLNVNRPVRVFRKSETRGTQPQVTERASDAHGLAWRAIGEGLLAMLVFIAGAQDEDVDLSCEDRVPRFWANSATSDFFVADLIMLGIGICFGAIHCIAWHFSFPTHIECRYNYCPRLYPFGVQFRWLAEQYELQDFRYFYSFFFGPISGGILYIIARGVTLVLAFISLRDPPPGAYETVHWTTFIPHV